MEEEHVIIPRNIKAKEIFAYGMNAKQILYLTISAGGVLTIWTEDLPIDVKIAGSIACISAALGFSLSKINGQELDRYVYNSIKYPLRQKEFGGESNAKTPTCHIRYVL